MLDTGCFIFWNYPTNNDDSPPPQVSDGFVTLKVKSPVMLDQNDTTYTPKLSSRNHMQGESFPVFYRRVVAVPWFLITDSLITPLNKYSYTPVYRIVRDSYFVLGEFRHNQTSLNYELVLSNKTGVSNTTEKTSWQSMGIEVSASVGFKFASASFKITKEMGFATMESASEFRETTVTDKLLIPPGKAGGLFQKYSDLHVKSRDNITGFWDDNVGGKMTVVESYIVPDEYPDE